MTPRCTCESAQSLTSCCVFQHGVSDEFMYKIEKTPPGPLIKDTVSGGFRPLVFHPFNILMYPNPLPFSFPPFLCSVSQHGVRLQALLVSAESDSPGCVIQLRV